MDDQNTNTNLNNLQSVDNDHFNRVFQILHETYESERHFNELEKDYRILASQWLLASFAGMGFIITSDPHLAFDKLWLVVGICVIASIGIGQLWRMDMIVYHRLLSACFKAGVEFENEIGFIPKIKKRMLDSVPEKDVTHVLFYYYFFSIAVLCLTATALIIYLVNDWLALWSELIIIVIVVFGLYKMQSAMRKHSREIELINHL